MIDIPNISDVINNLLKQSKIYVDPIVGQIIATILIILFSFILGYIVYNIFEHYFTKLAKKTKTTIDDEIIKNIKKPIYFLVILLGCYYAFDQLTVLDIYWGFIAQIFLYLGILLVAFIITRIINVFVAWYAEKKTKKGGISNNILLVFKKLLNLFVYIFAFLTILYIRKIDLSGAIVGLGVTGIAIAFALQNILSDFFSAFSIYFDRPFEIGDFVIIGDKAGTVTNISMKSTRIQLLHGEELILSNKEITNIQIRNYKKMRKRRVDFTIGVTYDTPLEKLKKIPDIIKNSILNCELTEVDRIHFKEYGPYSLNFEVVYYVNTPDYTKNMDIRQKINYAIKEAFEKEGIEFAFPTQTVFLNK
ncbi:MAG: mechanosensitive ion channel family protein [Candidatus Thermoplasmatota archaeon]|nr:mechanosensitive ion channel family protein [Candidatus Thermoplasmatota archaeon]